MSKASTTTTAKTQPIPHETMQEARQRAEEARVANARAAMERGTRAHAAIEERVRRRGTGAEAIAAARFIKADTFHRLLAYEDAVTHEDRFIRDRLTKAHKLASELVEELELGR